MKAPRASPPATHRARAGAATPPGTPAWRAPDLPIRVGISACLLGEEVRYDGGHQRDSYIVGTLARHFTFVPVCPEMEIGLGVPRETLRLVGDPAAPRLVGTASGADHTARMRAWARERVTALAALGLSGYLLKRASPSCGMERVRVYTEAGMPSRAGRGLFARALLDGLPHLPVEEEGRLGDPLLRDHFVTRVFAHRRLRALLDARPDAGDLVAFHAAHKFLLLSHSPDHYARLGRLVADGRAVARGDGLGRYERGFLEAIAVKPTRARHVNVLQHLIGYFKDRLSPAEKRELGGLVEEYRTGLVPLIVPITLVNHFVTRFDIAYIKDQVYLHPHPRELMLRNQI